MYIFFKLNVIITCILVFILARLIVLSTSDTKGGGATNNPASTASHQVSNLVCQLPFGQCQFIHLILVTAGSQYVDSS